MQHLILQHYLHIDLHGTEAEGLVLQKNLAITYTQNLLPSIERVFNRLTPSKEHWIIDHLELDLGLQNYESIDTWAKTLELVLEQALLELKPTNNQTTNFESKAQSTSYQTIQGSLQTAFLHFLQTGSLPWSFRLPFDQSLEQALLADWQASSNSLILLEKQAILKILASMNARQRLTWQFSSEFLLAFMLRLAPNYAELIKPILQQLASTRLQTTNLKTFTWAVWQTSFKQLVTGQSSHHTSIIRGAFQSLPTVTQSELWKPLSSIWLDALQEASPIQDSHSLSSSKALNGSITALQLNELNSLESFYTSIAGLVLLHPFLPTFFQALGISDNERLLQPERAPALLYFLATGQAFAPEHELSFPKVLCNLPIDQPVLADADLSELERAEAESLLQAVIHHWTALQNTSPNGLRANFLMRLGKVSLNSDGEWLLQVEHQTYDLLLDQLPWGIGMFKLPWMQRLFWVEWY